MSEPTKTAEQRLEELELRMVRIEKALGLRPWSEEELLAAQRQAWFDQDEPWREEWRKTRPGAEEPKNSTPAPRGILR